MNVFSIPTLLWRERPPSSGPPIARHSLETIADAARDAGFEAIGIDDATVGSRDPTDVACVLRERGLRCTDVGILFLGRSRTLAEAERLAQLAGATGATACIAVTGKPYERATLVAELRACGDILRRGGARLALEFVPYVHLKTLDETIELCEAAGWERCGVLFDTLHFLRSGAPWETLRAMRGDQIALVHADDAGEPGADLDEESRGGRLPLGEGTFPLPAFVDVLAEIGYDGPISVEVLNAELKEGAPLDYARTLHASLPAWTPSTP